MQATKLIQNPVKGSYNPFFKNKYADLGTVIECIKDVLLNRFNVIIFQDCEERESGGCVDVSTVFIDGDTGEEYATTVSVHLKDLSPQGSMGAFTYGRRYALKAAFMLADEDDDGNVASGKSDEVKTEVTKESTQKAATGLNAILGKAK